MSNDRDSWRRSDNDQKPDGASLQYNKGAPINFNSPKLVSCNGNKLQARAEAESR